MGRGFLRPPWERNWWKFSLVVLVVGGPVMGRKAWGVAVWSSISSYAMQEEMEILTHRARIRTCVALGWHLVAGGDAQRPTGFAGELRVALAGFTVLRGHLPFLQGAECQVLSQ